MQPNDLNRYHGTMAARSETIGARRPHSPK